MRIVAVEAGSDLWAQGADSGRGQTPALHFVQPDHT
jgi:hypothetical protein